MRARRDLLVLSSFVAVHGTVTAQVSVSRQTSLSPQLNRIWRKPDSSWERNLRETYYLMNHRIAKQPMAAVRKMLKAEGIREIELAPITGIYEFLLLGHADVRAGDLHGDVVVDLYRGSSMGEIDSACLKWGRKSQELFDVGQIQARGLLSRILKSSHFKERLKAGRARAIELKFGPLYEPGISQEALGYTVEIIFDRDEREFGLVYRAASGLDPCTDISTGERKRAGSELLRRGAFPDMPRISNAPADDAIWVSGDGTQD